VALEVEPRRRQSAKVRLSADFEQRLEASLAVADRERRRRQWYGRGRRILAVVLLIGPVVAWRLTLVAPGGLHAVVEALAWLTFLLDVGVHVDNSALTYLGLQGLPTIVGALLFGLLALTFLGSSKGRK
jgi:hypothetical protein